MNKIELFANQSNILLTGHIERNKMPHCIPSTLRAKFLMLVFSMIVLLTSQAKGATIKQISNAINIQSESTFNQEFARLKQFTEAMGSPFGKHDHDFKLHSEWLKATDEYYGLLVVDSVDLLKHILDAQTSLKSIQKQYDTTGEMNAPYLLASANLSYRYQYQPRYSGETYNLQTHTITKETKVPLVDYSNDIRRNAYAIDPLSILKQVNEFIEVEKANLKSLPLSKDEDYTIGYQRRYFEFQGLRMHFKVVAE